MKAIKRISAMLLALAVVMPAMAQFKIGPRVGFNANTLHFNSDILDSDNRMGLNAGLQAEIMLPILGLGLDASVMYVHRSSDNINTDDDEKTKLSTDYIEIPINVKYKIGLPGVGKIITPFVFTGPSFAFRTSKSVIDDIKANKSDIAWNFGFGVELIQHLQIGASYGLGLTKAYEEIEPDHANAGIEGKNRYWTVTAAWLF